MTEARRDASPAGCPRVVIGTANRHKILEIRRLVGDLPIAWLDLNDFPPGPEVEEPGATFEENARLKAEAYSRRTGLPALADDSGLEVDALGGRPGVLSARWAGPAQDAGRNIDKLLADLAEVPEARRTARFVCVVALAEAGRTIAEARGTCEGVILRARRGAGGFGYDPIFLVPAVGRTFAELAPEKKDLMSHRARALQALRPALVSECAGGVRP